MGPFGRYRGGAHDRASLPGDHHGRSARHRFIHGIQHVSGGPSGLGSLVAGLSNNFSLISSSAAARRPDDAERLVAADLEFHVAEGQKQNWLLLNKFLKKHLRPIVLFENLPFPKENQNPHFKKYGILAHPFSLEGRKYLMNRQWVLEKCPELRYRALGVNVVAADLRAFPPLRLKVSAG